MPAIFSKKQKATVWEMFQKNITRKKMAETMHCDEATIDAIIKAAAKEYVEPALVYKKTITAPRVIPPAPEPKPKVLKRPPAMYSNPDYSTLYL